MVKKIILLVFVLSTSSSNVLAWSFDTPFGEAKGDDIKPIPSPPPLPPPPSVPDLVEKAKATVSDAVEGAKKSASEAGEVVKSTLNNADNEQKKATTSVSNELNKISGAIAVESKHSLSPITDVFSNIRKQLELSVNDGKRLFAPLTDKSNELTDKLDNWWRNKSDNDSEVKHQKKMIDDAEIEHANKIAAWNVEIDHQNSIRNQALTVVNDFSKIKLLKNSVGNVCKNINTVTEIDDCNKAIQSLILNENTFLRSYESKYTVQSNVSQSFVDLFNKIKIQVEQDAKSNVEMIVYHKNKREQLFYKYNKTALNISCSERAITANKYLLNVLQKLKLAILQSDAWGVRIARNSLIDYRKIKTLLLPSCDILNSNDLIKLENRIYLTYSAWNEDLWFKSACQQYSQYTKFNTELNNQSEMLFACQKQVKTDQFISSLSQEIIQLRKRGGVR